MSKKVNRKRKKSPTLAKPSHPDLRTKAGRAWKARQVEKARRAKIRNEYLDLPRTSVEVNPELREILRAACPGGHLHDGAGTPPDMSLSRGPSAPHAYSRVGV
jgi:hypothetical protein